MFRINSSGATGDGRFKETPAPATRLAASWLNALQDEVVTVITDPAGGDAALDPGDSGQMLAAIQTMLGRLVDQPDSQTLVLGPVILKYGRVTGSFSEGQVYVPFTTAFPTAIRSVLVTSINNALTSRDIWGQEGQASTGGFYAMLQYGGGQNNSADGFNWLAIGD